MNNVNELSGSGERLSFFKLFSEKKFKVEIPIIQRDYAQGRASEKEVRDTFLNALFEYLQQGKPNRDLDFVYGTVLTDGGSSRFIPLDGQQRLTTLFLLHWYLAQISNQTETLKDVLLKNNKSQFSYETRTSSSEFCDALIVNDIDMSNLVNADLKENNSLSKTIKDKGWFYLSWINDPTIQSMLTMLDSIHAKFSDYPQYFQLLIDEEKPVITFLYLNLKEFNLTDDLYIKMNARGKPLTPFENFKAKFEQQIKSFKCEWTSYKLNFKKEPVNGYQYFIHKIDTDWADIFWGYRNTFSKDDTFDDELMNFIRLIVSNYHLLYTSSSPEAQTVSREMFYESGGKLRELSFIEYNELGCFSQGFVKHLITIFDLLHNEGVNGEKISSYLKDNSYYSEDDTFRKVIKNETSYPEKLRFFAFYTYLSKSPKPQELIEWMRVIYNLTENTIINTSGDFCNALITVDQLCHFDTPILLTLKNNCEIKEFTGAQVVEEKIKAHLLLKYQDWRVAIIGAEQHTFLNGQIGCILNFAGILAFYRKYGNCEWDEEQDQQFLANFIKYANLIGAVFDLIGKSSSAINFLWERAVLSKGVYFTEKKSGDRFNLLSSRDARNNIPRDHSWRRLLRIGSSEIEQKQAYVKDVLDDLNFESGDITTSLEKICNSALKKTDIESCWQVLIEHKELIRYCNQGFIEKNSHEFILLNESQRNHYHSELYTKALEIVLSKDKSLLAPFSCIDYHPVKSRDEKAFLEISGYFLDVHSYSLEVRKNKSTFEIKFKGGKPSNYSDALKSILTHLNFELVEIDFEGIDGLEGLKIDCDFANNKLNKLGDVINKVSNLCSDLRDLSNE
jgi:hypothetical protein